jgi:tetratricopeptide (TPR) repeat protein
MRELAVVLVSALAGCGRSAVVNDADERNDVAFQQARSKRSVPSEAIRAYRQILDRNPTMALAHLDLALLLHDSAKDYVGAIYHYRRYLELRQETQKSPMITARIQEATRRFARQVLGEGHATNATGSGLSVDAVRLVDENASLKIELARLTQELETLRGNGQESAPAEGPAPVEGPASPGGPALERAATSGTRASPRTELLKPAPAADRGSDRAAATSPPPAPAPASAGKARTYKVRQKETLYGIADTVYGDKNRWKRILDANSGLLKGDPKHLRVGMELTIP